MPVFHYLDKIYHTVHNLSCNILTTDSFNITLLFTRYLLRFRMINYDKPLLDAFQGSYKDKYYYWVGLHLTMRSLFFFMYAFQTRLKLILSTMDLIPYSFAPLILFRVSYMLDFFRTTYPLQMALGV